MSVHRLCSLVLYYMSTVISVKKMLHAVSKPNQCFWMWAMCFVVSVLKQLTYLEKKAKGFHESTFHFIQIDHELDVDFFFSYENRTITRSWGVWSSRFTFVRTSSYATIIRISFNFDICGFIRVFSKTYYIFKRHCHFAFIARWPSL